MSPPRPRPRPAPPPSRWVDERDARLERFKVLFNISKILTTTSRHETVLKLILRECVKATRATSGSLILIDRERGVLDIEIAYRLDPALARRLKLLLGQGVTGWVALTGKPLLVGDVRRSPHYVKVRGDVRSELAVPVKIGDEVIAVINVDNDKPDAFVPDDLDLLVAAAAQAGRVMHVARLNDDNRRKAKRLETLFSIAGTVASEPLLEDVLRRVADEVRRLMDVRVCSTVMLDETGKWFEIKAVSGPVAPEYVAREKFEVEGSLIGEVIDSRRPLYIADVREEPRYRLTAIARQSGMCSLLAVPMLYLNRTIGVLNIYTGERRAFPEDDVALLQTFAGHCAVAIENARRYQRIFRSEEMLRQAEKFSLLGTLAAEIAHEIRNPLTILSLLTHSVGEDPGLSKASRSDLKVIQKKLAHINTIVDQVLDFSREDREEVFEEADLDSILDDVAVLVGHKAATTNLRVVRRGTPGLPPVRVNPGQIEQAVLNLAMNGLQAMAERGEKLTLRSGRVEREGRSWARILVADEGCGIPEDKIPRLFSPYFSMRDGGTGLGLFITGKIVARHGGRVRVLKSRPGEGTTFEIQLPIDGEPSRNDEART